MDIIKNKLRDINRYYICCPKGCFNKDYKLIYNKENIKAHYVFK